jgi:hypothetical protein
MKHVVATNTIDPPTKNERKQQNYSYFNLRYYMKYEVLAMGAKHSYIL